MGFGDAKYGGYGERKTCVVYGKSEDLGMQSKVIMNDKI